MKMLAALLLLAGSPAPTMNLDSSSVESALTVKFGAAQRDRIHRGVAQMAQFWRPEDGDAKVFADFAIENFASTQPEVDELFSRMQALLESLDGHMLEIGRDFRKQTDLDLGPAAPLRRHHRGLGPGRPRGR